MWRFAIKQVPVENLYGNDFLSMKSTCGSKLISFVHRTIMFVTSGSSWEINKVFPIPGKDTVCLVVLLNSYQSVPLSFCHYCHKKFFLLTGHFQMNSGMLLYRSTHFCGSYHHSSNPCRHQ